MGLQATNVSCDLSFSSTAGPVRCVDGKDMSLCAAMFVWSGYGYLCPLVAIGHWKQSKAISEAPLLVQIIGQEVTSCCTALE